MGLLPLPGRGVSTSIPIGIVVIGVGAVLGNILPSASADSAIPLSPTILAIMVVWWLGFIQVIAPFVITREVVIAWSLVSRWSNDRSGPPLSL